MRLLWIGVIAVVGFALTGCSGDPAGPRELTPEELEKVKQEDMALEEEESTGGTGQKPPPAKAKKR